MQKEGGYVHHKADRGGPTNMGVTQKTLSTYLGRPASVEDVKNVNRDTARDIFHTMYWQPMGADKLDPKVAGFSRRYCMG
jgi:lysozyme family protein